MEPRLDDIEQVRLALDRERRQGVSFDVAWSRALALFPPLGKHEREGTERCDLLDALAGTRSEWEAALPVIMGPATISMTFDVYGHLMPNRLDDAATAANAYLARLTGHAPALAVVGAS